MAIQRRVRMQLNLAELARMKYSGGDTIDAELRGIQQALSWVLNQRATMAPVKAALMGGSGLRVTHGRIEKVKTKHNR